MARRAIILLAGTLLATTLSPRAATSQTFQQSSVDNQQTQDADVSASQTLNVVTVDQTTGITSAGGYSAAVQSGSLDVESVQTANGNVTATTTLNVSGTSGATTLTTAATGNTGANDSLGYADLTGTLRQTTGAATIDAESQINASTGYATGVNASVQAIGNNQDIGTIGGSATMTVDQVSAASVLANGGAVMNYAGENNATFSSVANGNNVTFTGTNGTTTALEVNQANTGAGPLQATEFVAVGNGQTIAGSSSALANNISVTNENSPLGLSANQNNVSYIRAQTEVSAYEFGSASATASGIGNSVVVGNSGGDLTLDNTQLNAGGGVEVLSSFTGGAGIGYDGSASATAIGNAVTGYGCSTCTAKMNVTNRQTNSTEVTSTSTVNSGTQNRSVTGVSTAMGNSATFYVSQPDD